MNFSFTSCPAADTAGRLLSVRRKVTDGMIFFVKNLKDE
jgi:hypothetical protein